jgi:hypothetical protein
MQARLNSRALKLINDLDRAVREQSSQRINATQRRQLYVWVLTKISIFIREIGTTKHSRLFYDLALALDDLDRGIVAPFLKPPVAHSAQSSEKWRARANVAVGLVALEKAGLGRDEAARYAVREFPDIELLKSVRSSNPTKAALSWRDDFAERRSEQRLKNKEGRSAFSSGVNMLEVLTAKEDIKAFANQHFRIAAEIARRT